MEGKKNDLFSSSREKKTVKLTVTVYSNRNNGGR
jgi:hypothetical protein